LLRKYAAAVRTRGFPGDEHSYAIEDGELRRFLAAVQPIG
jgi:hypothetical protein